MPFAEKLSPEVKALFISDFKAGLSTKALAAKYGVCAHTARRILIREKLVTKRVKPTLNESCFDETTEASAYWIGMLITDGCVTKNRDEKWAPTITLRLSVKDKAHIEEFRRFLGSSHSLHETVSKDPNGRGKLFPQVGISLRSKKLARRLAEFGVVPRKSSTALVRQLEGNRHFWRGAIDGDGSVMVRRSDGYPTIKLVGSRQLVTQWLAFVKTFTSTRATVRSDRNIFVCVISGDGAVSVANELYGDCTTALTRKLKKAKAILDGASKL